MIGISCIPRFYGNLVDNQTETLITSFSYTVLSPYLVWGFLGTRHRPHTSLLWNLVAMATRLKLE